MKIRKYGMVLERLRECDIEMVRRYRNSAEIRRHMHYRTYITKEMQHRWFKSIDNEFNFYFIIRYDGKRIGLINIKNIDWIKCTSESGLFIWDPDYAGSPAPLLASLLLSEFGFGILKGDKTFIRIISDNKKAIEFNTRIGFEPSGLPDADNLQFYIQTKDNFIKKTKKLRKSALELYDKDEHFYLYVEPHDNPELRKMFFAHMAAVKLTYEMKKKGVNEIYSFIFDF